MEPVNLFNLAAQQSRWLAVRQSAVAGNVANANTPGYGSVDVEPFEKVLANTTFSMTATQTAHFGSRASDAGTPAAAKATGEPSLLPSKNNIVVENEMMKAGEIRRAFELNTAIVKAFHRMIMLSTK